MSELEHQESVALDQPPKVPPLDFDRFLQQVRSPPADPIIRYIRSFLSKFIPQSKTFSTDEQSRLIQNFKLFIFDKFQEYQPFSGMDENDLRNCRLGMEKLIMSKLYPYVFAPELILTTKDIHPTQQEDLDVDSQIFANYITFNEILTPQDFEVNAKLASKGKEFINISIEELSRINSFKTPRSKLICILNSCKALIQLLKSTQSVSNADEFLPLLIFTVFRGQIEHLYCNLQFIERFRFEMDGGNEAEYYLVCLSSAAEFIKNLHVEFKEKLNVDGSVTIDEDSTGEASTSNPTEEFNAGDVLGTAAKTEEVQKVNGNDPGEDLIDI